MLGNLKDQNKLRLAKEVKNNRKGFFTYVQTKRKKNESTCHLLNECGKMLIGIQERKSYSSSVWPQFSRKSRVKCNYKNEGVGLKLEVNKNMVREFLFI